VAAAEEGTEVVAAAVKEAIANVDSRQGISDSAVDMLSEPAEAYSFRRIAQWLISLQGQARACWN